MGDDERRGHGIELQHDVHRAAVLECAAGLQVLALEKDFAPHARIECGRPHDGRAHDVRTQARGRGHHVGERGERRGHECEYSGAMKCSR
jgi:hypothetical protein